jgi:hypothetical protein
MHSSASLQRIRAAGSHRCVTPYMGTSQRSFAIYMGFDLGCSLRAKGLARNVRPAKAILQIDPQGKR